MEHQIASSVLSVGLLVFVAHFFTALFERTKVPDVLPLILIGIVIGPTIFNFVDESNFGNLGSILSAIALALKLFEGGSHMTFETLRSTLRDCVLLSIATFFFTAGITFTLLYFVLQQALLPAFYIGALGSQRNHKHRIRRLTSKGSDKSKLNRIHGPVGLDIGGNHPNEIAVSILAEIIAIRNGKTIGIKSN